MLDISKLIEQVAGGRSAKMTVDSFLKEAEEAASTPFQDPKGMKMAIKGSPESMPTGSAPSDGDDLRGEETSGEAPLSRKIESFLRLFEEEGEEDLEESDDEKEKDLDESDDEDEDDLKEEEDEELTEEDDEEDLKEEDSDELEESDDELDEEEEDDDSPKTLEEMEDEELEESDDEKSDDKEEEDDEEDNEPKSSDGDEITESTVSKFQTGQLVSYSGSEYDHLKGQGTILIDVPHANGIMYVVEWQNSGTALIPESDLR